MAPIARYFDPHNALCARMSERARLVLASIRQRPPRAKPPVFPA